MNKKGKILILIVLMSLVFLGLPVWAGDEKTSDLESLVEIMEEPKAKPATSGFRIGLRLSGGLTFFDGGDINDTKSNVTVNEYSAGEAGVPYTINEQDLNRSFEGSADLLFYLGKRFGVALGASYMNGKSENKIVIDLPSLPPATYTVTFDPAVSAVPVTVGLFFTPPLGGRFDLLAEVGGGWTFARLAIDQKFIGSLGSMQFTSEGNAGGPCVYARLGLEAGLGRGFFFFVEALGRIGKIRGFSGISKFFQNGILVYSGNGRFYTFDQNVSGHPIRFIDFADDPPSGATVSNVSETRIDFSGVSARGGFRIRF
jgi:hypothetical protein